MSTVLSTVAIYIYIHTHNTISFQVKICTYNNNMYHSMHKRTTGNIYIYISWKKFKYAYGHVYKCVPQAVAFA